MRECRVARDGSAPYESIEEALRAVAADEPVILRLGAGEYREKLLCNQRSLAIIGEGRENTRIVWGDAAYDDLPDGKRGTFRSYTAFFGGETLRLSNLTIENDAGDGEARGQAVAAALHARRAWCENVAFLGCQDTLFCAPLPESERQPRGFRGPREFAPRERTAQLFQRCVISGTVDYIFGGANAVFEDCELLCRKRPKDARGYVVAPCTPDGELGMVFLRCRVRGEAGCANGSYALGRPWREHASAAFVGCELDACVSAAGFAPWRGDELPPDVRFAAAGCFGQGSRFEESARFYGKLLSGAEADKMVSRAKALADCAREAWLG